MSSTGKSSERIESDIGNRSRGLEAKNRTAKSTWLKQSLPRAGPAVRYFRKLYSMGPNEKRTGGEQTTQDKKSGGGWVFPVLLLVVLAVVFGVGKLGLKDPHLTGTTETPVGWLPSEVTQDASVGLTVDFGNGVKKQFDALPWHEGMTVESLMQEAKDWKPGIFYSQLGEGETGFLESIDGLKNEGLSGRNWKYEVNEKYAEIGFCLHPLEPGDRLLWKFAGQE